MDFGSVRDRAVLTVGGARYLVVAVKELPGWRSLAIFDYESGRIAAEVERADGPHRVFLPLDDRAVYVGDDVAEAIARVLDAERPFRALLTVSGSGTCG